MKIDNKGNISINLSELVSSMDDESVREVIKTLCTSQQALKWIMDYLCDEDEDGWLDGGIPQKRLELLARVEDKCLDGAGMWYDWRVLNELKQHLQDIRCKEHIYYQMYHHPDVYTMTIAEFLRQVDNPYTTERADADIKRFENMVKDALDKMKREKSNNA